MNLKKIGHVTKKITDGSHFSPELLDDGYPYVTVKDIDKLGFIDTTNCKKISLADFNLFTSNGCKPKINDLLISKDGTIGKSAIVKNDNFVILSSLAILRFKKEFNVRYCYYWSISDHFMKQATEGLRGAALMRLTLNKISNFTIPFFNLSTQERIVSFLDEKCSKIDKEIDLLEKKSILLDEYKNALIYETVTKGLDKNAEMKDSGVDWIGDIPKHWEIKRIKDIASLEKGKANEMFTFEEKENYYLPCIDTNFLRGRENHIMYNKNGRLTQSGDVLILWDGANAGELFINPEKGYLGSTFGKFIHKKNVNNMFLFYYLKGIEKYFRSNLVGMGIPHVNSTKLKTSIFIYPSYNEQINIVKFLDFETKKIENQIELINKKIELLKEYKQSLIYEAVTGQLDIE